MRTTWAKYKKLGANKEINLHTTKEARKKWGKNADKLVWGKITKDAAK